MKTTVICMVAVLSACTMRGEIPQETREQHMACIDTRDGERFAFHGRTIRDVRLGLGGTDSCFTITDDAGAERQLCKSHEAWVKCAPVKGRG